MKSCQHSSMWITCGACSHLASAEPGHLGNEWAASSCMKLPPIATIETRPWLRERRRGLLEASWSLTLWALKPACFKCHKQKRITVNMSHHVPHSRVFVALMCSLSRRCVTTITGSSSVSVFLCEREQSQECSHTHIYKQQSAISF